MPTDVSIDVVSDPAGAFETSVGRCLPIGIGLTLGAYTSLALWTFIALCVRALVA